MGMDVYGRKPKHAAGEYFRASVWSWRPLLGVMINAGVDVPRNWSYNDGAGPMTQKECDAIADKLDAYLSNTLRSEFSMPSVLKCDAEGVLGQGDQSPYRIAREHVLQFTVFLRNCGGFKIF